MNTLWASLIWGAVGSGLLIYGKKQTAMLPMLGGLAMIGASYFCESAMVMSAVSLAIVTAIWRFTTR